MLEGNTIPTMIAGEDTATSFSAMVAEHAMEPARDLVVDKVAEGTGGNVVDVAAGAGAAGTAGAAVTAGAAGAAPAEDRRIVRTREALWQALAAEIHATQDLTRVTVTSLCERAGVTRRTFYSHYKDIPDLVQAVEKNTLEDITPYMQKISQTTLAELEASVAAHEPCPGSLELVSYMGERVNILSALLGRGGDPAFSAHLRELARHVVAPRALDGLDLGVVGPLFDYYLTFAIAAEVGVLVRWLCRGAKESPALMARVMTMLMFVRPGDLYGRQLDFDAREFGLALLSMTLEEQHGQD